MLSLPAGRENLYDKEHDERLGLRRNLDKLLSRKNNLPKFRYFKAVNIPISLGIDVSLFLALDEKYGL